MDIVHYLIPLNRSREQSPAQLRHANCFKPNEPTSSWKDRWQRKSKESVKEPSKTKPLRPIAQIRALPLYISSLRSSFPRMGESDTTIQRASYVVNTQNVCTCLISLVSNISVTYIIIPGKSVFKKGPKFVTGNFEDYSNRTT